MANLTQEQTRALLDSARSTAPICLGVATNDGWNQEFPTPPPEGTPPNHMVDNISTSPSGEIIYDHYVPFAKTFIASYPINQAIQGVVTITNPVPKPIPSAPTLPLNPTQPQVQNWLTQLLVWLGIIKAEKLTSNMDTFNFSFLKSYAFWAKAITLLSVIFTALSTQYPTEVFFGTIVSVLSLISSTYFQKQEVLAAAQSSVTLGRVVSGQ